MRYLWDRGPGAKRRVMHIARFTETGELLMQAICGIDRHFNTSINAPWGLGKRICKRCKAVSNG